MDESKRDTVDIKAIANPRYRTIWPLALCLNLVLKLIINREMAKISRRDETKGFPETNSSKGSAGDCKAKI